MVLHKKGPHYNGSQLNDKIFILNATNVFYDQVHFPILYMKEYRDILKAWIQQN